MQCTIYSIRCKLYLACFGPDEEDKGSRREGEGEGEERRREKRGGGGRRGREEKESRREGEERRRGGEEKGGEEKGRRGGDVTAPRLKARGLVLWARLGEWLGGTVFGLVR